MTSTKVKSQIGPLHRQYYTRLENLVIPERSLSQVLIATHKVSVTVDSREGLQTCNPAYSSSAGVGGSI